MGADKVRHLQTKTLASGEVGHFWNPSKTLRDLGMCAEALGTDANAAIERAIHLNNLADELRRGSKEGSNGPRPGTFALLFEAYRASEEFGALKPRTRRDYEYYGDKINAEFGHVLVIGMTPKPLKTYYKGEKRVRGVTWAYHIMSTLRAILSWAVSEEWVERNYALDVPVQSPPKRTVTWAPEQALTYIAKANELGWHSIAAMAHVFDSIGQSPVDVRTLRRGQYDGQRVHVSRAKTGGKGAPILLFPAAREALDAYLEGQLPKLPDAPLFTNDRIGGMWNESTLRKKHAIIRRSAGLPTSLQLQDFRTTVQTEGGAAGGTVDELRGLAHHSTRDAGEHYVHPDERFVDSIQGKRLAYRNRSDK